MAKFVNLKDGELKILNYSNGRKALRFFDKETGELLVTASVNIPAYPLNEGEVLIKDYSENEGVLNDLISMEIISKPINAFKYGMVEIYVCKLLID